MVKSCLVCILTFITCVGFATAAGDTAASRAWQAVQAGEAVIVMRHAIAPGVGDPAGFDLQRCSTQRNLSEAGRQQAARVGNVLRANGILQAQVFSSQWCRCLETAELLKSGKPLPAEMLNSFFQNRGDESEQNQALKVSVRQWVKEKVEPVVLVTHQVNITALTGLFAGSGDMLIVTIIADEPEVLARISTK